MSHTIFSRCFKVDVYQFKHMDTRVYMQFFILNYSNVYFCGSMPHGLNCFWEVCHVTLAQYVALVLMMHIFFCLETHTVIFLIVTDMPVQKVNDSSDLDAKVPAHLQRTSITGLTVTSDPSHRCVKVWCRSFSGFGFNNRRHLLNFIHWITTKLSIYWLSSPTDF